MRWLILAIFQAAILVGCAQSETRTVVTLWHQMRPGDRKVLSERVDQFQQYHPEVVVRLLYKETEELRSGLESAVLVGRGPAIVYGPSDVTGVYHTIGALQDLSEWFPATELEKFDPQALVWLPARGDPTVDQLLMVGDRFGNHVALVYNRAFISEPPQTTDDLVRIAKANTIDENADGRPERYGLAWNYTEPFFVIPFLTGYGAWVFGEQPSGSLEENDRPIPALDTPESIAAYQFVSDLRHKHNVLPRSSDYEAASALFLAGKAAMLIDGDWSWQKYLSSKEVDAAVALLPMVSETGLPMAPMVSTKGYSLSVAAQGATRDAAMELIQFLTSEPTQRAFLEKQRILPSRLALRQDPLVEDDPTLQISIAQAERGRLMPTDTEMRAVWDGMRPSYQALMGGQLNPAEAAHKMQQTALDNIERMTTTIQRDASATLVQVFGLLGVLAVMVLYGRKVLEFFRDVPRQPLAYAFVLPTIVVIFFTVLFPLAYNVVLSFSNMSLGNFRDWEVVGVHHYLSLLSGSEAGKFWGLFGKTVFWTAINVFFHVAVGILLAVTINGPVRGKSIYRILLIIPWAVPAYITALTWRGMFDFEFGAINHAIVALNQYLPGFLQLPVLDWLNTAGPAFSACIIANVWLGFPFMMVIALGGLQGIPGELYEAARIDGASRWSQFWNITLPLLKPVLIPAVTLGAIWTFNNLNVVWLVSNGGQPSDQTHIMVSYVYKAVFNLYQYGYGAALSMMIFFILLVFSMLFLRSARATDNVYA